MYLKTRALRVKAAAIVNSGDKSFTLTRHRQQPAFKYRHPSPRKNRRAKKVIPAPRGPPHTCVHETENRNPTPHRRPLKERPAAPRIPRAAPPANGAPNTTCAHLPPGALFQPVGSPSCMWSYIGSGTSTLAAPARGVARRAAGTGGTSGGTEAAFTQPVGASCAGGASASTAVTAAAMMADLTGVLLSMCADRKRANVPEARICIRASGSLTPAGYPKYGQMSRTYAIGNRGRARYRLAFPGRGAMLISRGTRQG